MDCNFAVKVSLMIDGELSVEESEKVKNHLADCEECRNLEKDFLFFREQIKESAERKVFDLPEFLSERKSPFWKKAIAIPAPVLIGLLITFLGFGVWFWSAKVKQNEPLAKDQRNLNQPDNSSLARYDKGGRAEIYVLRNESK